ncbi:hypothetical protein COT98_02600 [Candidatus Falkowbacteria bacterium CG10_big_fil_rev_8_21_14_0_10_39_9]|uniref:LVIVD repeat protein n=1 Tax=Candidatus Falkowbacteria bacterium CG10_big_fil_rev_8_21_14_0_10_39_9 TaxID=1974566 RepID=A0A2M6WP80_9BACT|nr:MAG: hypothetical protein COT98_02600 [Candidatus Falkowbacteria bacterium CG10_big_fil_rev_8_21_14_0_10_39_9]
MAKYFQKKLTGFSMIEALLAGSLLALVIFTVASVLIFGQESSRIAGDSQRASALAEEGLEAARNMSEASFGSLSAGPHGLVVSGGKWQFSGTEDYTEIFTRSLAVSDLDSYTNAVTSTVNWSASAQRSGAISLTSRFTNWRRAGFSNWASTTVEAGYATTTNIYRGQRVLVDGNYAYVGLVSGTNNFIIFDISNPAVPVPVGRTTVTANINDMVISGNYVYIASSGNSNELVAVTVTNKTAPVVVAGAGYNAAGNGNGLAVDVVGNRLYLGRSFSATAGQGEFYIFNISNPAVVGAPLNTVAGFNLTAAVNDIEVSSNGFAYLATAVSTAELTILNVSNSASPFQAGVRNITGKVIGSAVTIFDSNADGIEDVAILALTTTGVIWPINVSTPSSPTLILASGYIVPGVGSVRIYDLELFNANKYLALATARSTAEVVILNITTLTMPTVLSTVNFSGTSLVTAYSLAYASGVDRLLVSTLRVTTLNYILQIIKPN